MDIVTRREALGSMAAAAALAAAPVRAQTPRPLVRSDIGTLKRVLVHSITVDDIAHDRLSDSLLPDAEIDLPTAVAQQAGLMRLLRAAGADVIELTDALQSAIEATRPSGRFETWLKASFPLMAKDPALVTAGMLLGRDARVRYQLGPDGNWRHIADEAGSGTMWTRDSAMMTPNGLVIGRSVSLRRRRENMLMRFVYAHAPQLKDYPIVFDAVEEGITIEGGDLMVVSPDLLFLGVGNRTDPRVAPILARRLGMDVLTVQTVKRDVLPTARPGDWGSVPELRLLLLHLDTYFTQVGPRHGLAVPWLLESAHA